MIEYIKGKIINISCDKLIIECSGIGYIVNTTSFFEKDKDEIIYIYTKKTEFEEELYGFKNKESKELFIYFLSIKGIGCKLAMNILKNDYHEIINALNNKDNDYFLSIPKIGATMANLITKNYKGNINVNNELVLVLKELGYKKQDIYKIVHKIDKSKKIDDQIKEAILLLE